MKCFHRNYFFLLTASALTTVLWPLTYTTSRYRTRFSLIMEVEGTAETLVLQKTLVYGQTGREVILTTNYFFVADNIVHIYIKNMHKINGLYKLMICLLYTSRCV